LFLGKPEALDIVMVHWLTLSSFVLILPRLALGRVF